jgi:flagellar hook assembly protein FlgD
VLSNEEHVVNAQVVRGVVELYRREQGSITGDRTGDKRRVSLAQNTPNPFGSETRLAFSLAEETVMDLSVYDVAGRRVATLLTGTMSAGDHHLVWNGKDSDSRRVAPGVYVFRLDTPEASVSRKMVMLE